MDSPAAIANRKRLIDVCEFWLDMGAVGFRVDMAHAMVKNDPLHKGTIRFWQEVFKVIKADYPDSVFLSEWNNPRQTVKQAGFDLDFYNPFGFSKASSYERDNERVYAGTYISEESKMFRVFLTPFQVAVRTINRTQGYQIIHQDNHDTIRMSRGRSDDMIRVLWAAYMTLPGVPLIYYGDEIGMRYQPLKSKDGGYHRTGARTPMQWDHTKNNEFSTTDGELYLPVEGPDSPYTVEAQQADSRSIYHTVKRLTHLKRTLNCLRATANFKVLHSGKFGNGNPFIYRRSSDIDELVTVILPRRQKMRIRMKKYLHGYTYDLIAQNADYNGGVLTCDGTSFAVFYRKKENAGTIKQEK